MKISAKGDYGLRAMVELAIRQGKGAVQIKDIAKAQGIPVKYLEQLMGALRGAGLVVSVRGAQGGYALAKLPGKVPVADVIEALEGPIYTMFPKRGPKTKKYSGQRVVSDFWKKIEEGFSNILKGTTLEDLALRKQELDRVPMYQI